MVATTIKAISTLYDGHRFRSRLEARWAVFFNHVGLQYEYEMEGYVLPKAGCYLPDFWLPSLGCFVEVKPNNDHEIATVAKCAELAIEKQCGVLLVCGTPSDDYGNRMWLLYGPRAERWGDFLPKWHESYRSDVEDFGIDRGAKSDSQIAIDFLLEYGDEVVWSCNAVDRSPSLIRRSSGMTKVLIEGGMAVAKRARFEFGEKG